MKKALFGFLLLVLCASQNGCALFAVSAAGAGGYSISEDTIEGIQESSFNQAWLAMRSTIAKDGAITLEDRTRGVIHASVKGSDVEGTINRVSEKTVKITFKARKAGGVFPDLDLAESLYDKTAGKIS